MNDPVDNNLGNQNIELNNIERNNIENVGSESKDARSVSSQGQTNFIQRMVSGSNIEEKLVQGITDKAKEKVYKSWLDRFLCCFNWLKRYFKITSKDFIKRIIQSIIPFNSKFYDLISSNPDFYGPFWIYTLFVVLVSGCGALTRTIQGRRDLNFYQQFIPTAALLIYFIGFFVPIFITVLSKIFGAKLNMAPVICVYGYSTTIFLPITIICSVPSSILQWILLGYGIISSSSLIIMSIAKSLSEIKKGKKIAIIVIIIIFQLVLFCVLKFYFFKHINKELNEDDTVNDVAKTIVQNTIAPIIENNNDNNNNDNNIEEEE
jgi:hypothetical protein